jgi:hypothetical protein
VPRLDGSRHSLEGKRGADLTVQFVHDRCSHRGNYL